MEKISFFGASVTKQKNGYAHYLSIKLNVNSECFGYGGNHLSDAGICFVDNIVKYQSNFCFIDFFSTSYIKTTNDTIDYLDAIVYKLTNIKCKLIFLFLPRDDHQSRIPFYNFVKKYLDSKKLYYIDLNEYISYSSEICRDSVHTTDIGSEKYADLIYSQFIKNKSKIILPLGVKKNKYDEIKKIDVNQIFQSEVILRGNCTIIGFYMMIGPKSGLIKINNIKYNIWDVHCHYERETFKLNDLVVNDQLKIEVLHDDFDHSTCRRPIIDVPKIKELNIKQIYYIGSNLLCNTPK